jgi:hypothetical protein
MMMKSSFRNLTTVCLTLWSVFSVSANQGPAAVQAPQTAAEALARYEQLLTATPGQPQKFYLTTKVAPTALAAGENAKATAYCQSLLQQAAEMPNDWNYGNAIHVAHLVLGHVALSSGDLAEAKRQLLEAGKTPGSPQLDSFGPNMLLAQQLLAKGEREVVLQYFELCAKFWEDSQGRLKTWKALVLEGASPDFRANLGYGLEVWRYDNWTKLQQ